MSERAVARRARRLLHVLSAAQEGRVAGPLAEPILLEVRTEDDRVAGIMRQAHIGLLRFDWRARTVALQLRDIDNRVAFEQVVQLSELS